MNSTHLCKRLLRTISLASLLLCGAAAQSSSRPQVWFSPLDTLLRPEVGYGGSPQYMDLFQPAAPWSHAAAKVNVFKIYPQWIGHATDEQLKAQFADLKRRDIKLALEYGVLSEGRDCSVGLLGEGAQGNHLLNAARRIQQDGGELAYLAMDEPFFFSTMSPKPDACRWTVDRAAADAASHIREAMTVFPNLQVGDIEPVGFSKLPLDQEMATYASGLLKLQQAIGKPLAFFHADVNWNTRPEQAVTAGRDLSQKVGTTYGVIIDGFTADRTDAQWIQDAKSHLDLVRANTSSSTTLVYQSWHPHPQKLMPDDAPDSFTGFLNSTAP